MTKRDTKKTQKKIKPRDVMVMCAKSPVHSDDTTDEHSLVSVKLLTGSGAWQDASMV